MPRFANQDFIKAHSRLKRLFVPEVGVTDSRV